MGKVDSILIPVFEADGPDYEADFCLWLAEQGRRLRLLRIPGIDTENLAEEIESLGRSDKRELHSRMQVLLTHLLKLRYQPERSSRSWRATLLEQRSKIDLLLDDSPSLRPTVAAVIEKEYAYARSEAADETGLDPARFPSSCEWTPDQVLFYRFFPG